MHRIRVRMLAAVCAALLALALQVPSQAAAADLPTAQKLLFESNHLTTLAAPGRLTYRYSLKTSDTALFGAGFDDDAVILLASAANGIGAKDATLELFTGNRMRRFGPLPNVIGNPIIVLFLEYDVNQMRIHVGGQPVYYRNVVRAAFRESAKVEPVSIVWQGNTASAMKVSIQPFMNIANAERLKLFRAKTYEFTVSDAVPGGIYEIRTVIADDRPGQTAPAIEARLTLSGGGYDTAGQ